MPLPAAAGTRGPPAREGLGRPGTFGLERGVRPNVTAGVAALRRFHTSMAGGFKIWGVAVVRNGGGATGSAAARPDQGLGLRVAVGAVAGATRRQLGGSADSILVWSLMARATPGETLDLLGIERWRCFCVVVPLQGIVLNFAPVEGTSAADGARPVAQVPMKIAPNTVMADDGGVFDIVSLSRHRRCSLRHQARDALGGTLDLSLPDRTMMAFSVSLSLLGASFWSK